MLQRAALGLILCLVATSFSSQAQSSKPVTAAIRCSRVLPETADAGYFTIIFVDNRGEVRRERITLGPNA
ncbi:MAG: hypothetical protein KJ064_01660 [Anaerolineae bacterium]|nr:hypothetical protein [Anaerolineae bacterium]